jgi:hypothetical protein
MVYKHGGQVHPARGDRFSKHGGQVHPARGDRFSKRGGQVCAARGDRSAVVMTERLRARRALVCRIAPRYPDIGSFGVGGGGGGGGGIGVLE